MTPEWRKGGGVRARLVRGKKRSPILWANDWAKPTPVSAARAPAALPARFLLASVVFLPCFLSFLLFSRHSFPPFFLLPTTVPLSVVLPGTSPCLPVFLIFFPSLSFLVLFSPPFSHAVQPRVTPFPATSFLSSCSPRSPPARISLRSGDYFACEPTLTQNPARPDKRGRGGKKRKTQASPDCVAGRAWMDGEAQQLREYKQHQ